MTETIVTYIIECPDPAQIEVGQAEYVVGGFIQLDTRFPIGPEVFGVVRGAKHERDFHKRLNHAKHEGAIYQYTDELRKHINSREFRKHMTSLADAEAMAASKQPPFLTFVYSALLLFSSAIAFGKADEMTQTFNKYAELQQHWTPIPILNDLLHVLARGFSDAFHIALFPVYILLYTIDPFERSDDLTNSRFITSAFVLAAGTLIPFLVSVILYVFLNNITLLTWAGTAGFALLLRWWSALRPMLGVAAVAGVVSTWVCIWVTQKIVKPMLELAKIIGIRISTLWHKVPKPNIKAAFRLFDFLRCKRLLPFWRFTQLFLIASGVGIISSVYNAQLKALDLSSMCKSEPTSMSVKDCPAVKDAKSRLAQPGLSGRRATSQASHSISDARLSTSFPNSRDRHSR